MPKQHPAQLCAAKVARENNLPEPSGERLLDTAFPKRFACYKIADGLVVYEDEPNCVVSIAERPGRLVKA